MKYIYLILLTSRAVCTLWATGTQAVQLAEIESCPSDPGARPKGSGQYPRGTNNQNTTQQRASNNKPPPMYRTGVEPYDSNDKRQRGSGGGGTGHVTVHREPDSVPRNNDPAVHFNLCDEIIVPQSRDLSKAPRVDGPSTLPNNKQDNESTGPRPQRPPPTRTRGPAPSGGTAPVPRESINTRISNTQSVSYISWADDPVSDAEMLVMADATTPKNQSSTNLTTPTQKSSNLSRSDILREAIVGSQLKNLRNKQPSSNVTVNRPGNSNTGKRAYEVSSGGESSGSKGGSYAEVASADGGADAWDKPKPKKKKKTKVDEPIMDLLGVKDSPNKEIFVMSLNCSMCKRTDQLEKMVKHHCRQRGVTVLYARAFKTRSDPNKANCKIAVSEADVARVFESDFWPEYVFVRYWYNNPNTNQQNSTESSSEDDSQNE